MQGELVGSVWGGKIIPPPQSMPIKRVGEVRVGKRGLWREERRRGEAGGSIR